MWSESKSESWRTYRLLGHILKDVLAIQSIESVVLFCVLSMRLTDNVLVILYSF